MSTTSSSKRPEGLSLLQKRSLLDKLISLDNMRVGKTPRGVGNHLRGPLSSSQNRLLFLQTLAQNSSSYNIPATLCMKGILRVEILIEALNFCVKRHDALRLSFPLDNPLIQVVDPDAHLEVPVIDLSAMPLGSREEYALQLISPKNWCIPHSTSYIYTQKSPN